jgi:hypothetical protein
VVLPAAIVTVAGTLAAAVFELDKPTTTPPVGAGPDIVTVPVTTVVELPFTVVGETVRDTKAGG